MEGIAIFALGAVVGWISCHNFMFDRTKEADAAMAHISSLFARLIRNAKFTPNCESSFTMDFDFRGEKLGLIVKRYAKQDERP